MQDQVWQFVTPFLRHALSLAAGWFGARGWLSGDEQASFINGGLGLILAGVAYWLSVRNKAATIKETNKAVEIAIKEPPPPAGLPLAAKVEVVKEKAAVALKTEANGP